MTGISNKNVWYNISSWIGVNSHIWYETDTMYDFVCRITHAHPRIIGSNYRYRETPKRYKSYTKAVELFYRGKLCPLCLEKLK